MFISLNLLKKYVDLEGVDPKDIALKMIEHTIEIDDVINRAEEFNNIIVGKIEKVESHPDADKLRVCQVKIKEKKGLLNKIVKSSNSTVQIVCGGSNLEVGMHVVVALPGAKVKWHGEGDLVEIKEAELRGSKSFGMICASSEIGLSDLFPAKDEKEIIDLDNFKSIFSKDLIAGESISELLNLNDVIFDIDNKTITHRPDLWGHYGIARELSVIYKKDLKSVELDKDLKFGDFTYVKLNMEAPNLCKAYNIVKINNIKVEESPKWLKEFLISIGQRPINNVVDLTNYVMFELGQPLHVFDSSKITNKIFVRLGKKGEQLHALNNEKIEIDDSMLLIADSIRPLAIAGVIGSIDSGVKDVANSIVLEAATFDGVSIRKTMQKLGFRTDAGARFEKQLDPNLAIFAINRFVSLLKQSNPKMSLEAIINFSNYDKSIKEIIIDFDFIRNKIGVEIKNEEIEFILNKLGFIIENYDEFSKKIIVPSFRNKDINIKEDLVEEIARIYGYNNIKPTPIRSILEKPLENELRVFERGVKQYMISNGFTEVLNYSFISKEDILDFKINAEDVIKLQNSLSVNQDHLRTTLIINLLKNVKDNLRYQNSFKLFEIERVFEKSIESSKYEGLPYQNYHFSGIVTEENNDIPFYSIKNYLDKLLNLYKFNFQYEVVKNNTCAYCHPGRYAKILINNEEVGYISELNPEISLKYKIKQRVSFFEVDFEKLFTNLDKIIEYKPISKFQKSKIDLSIIVNKDVLWRDIQNEVISVSKFIESVELFDVYQGNNIDIGKKSLAFTMIFANNEKTLTQEEIDSLWKSVFEKLKEKFGAEKR